MVPTRDRALAIGWMPTKGMPGRKRWKSQETGLLIPYFLAEMDPHSGTSNAGAVMMNLLQFSADYFKDILQAMREGKGGVKWSVAKDAAGEDYWRHMDAEVKTAVRNKFSGLTNHVWQPRSVHWPNHLLDCEVLQVVAAAFFELLKLE
jgi:hypothetical protein